MPAQHWEHNFLMKKFNDVKDILSISSSTTDRTQSTKGRTSNRIKKPKHIPKEIWALLKDEEKADYDNGSLDYFSINPMKKLMRNNASYYTKVRRLNDGNSQAKVEWKWEPFVNQARSDNLKLFHWHRQNNEESKEIEKRIYPFVRCNVKGKVPEITEKIVDHWIKLNGKFGNVSFNQLKYLIELVYDFDFKFLVVTDRWNERDYGKKDIIEIKEMFYSFMSFYAKFYESSSNNIDLAIKNIRNKVKSDPLRRSDKLNEHPNIIDVSHLFRNYRFDGNHERKRREQLHLLSTRTMKEVKEEEEIIQNLALINNQRKKQDEKARVVEHKLRDANSLNSNIIPTTGLIMEKKQKNEHSNELTVQLPSLLSILSSLFSTSYLSSNPDCSSLLQRAVDISNYIEKKTKSNDMSANLFQLMIKTPPIKIVELTHEVTFRSLRCKIVSSSLSNKRNRSLDQVMSNLHRMIVQPSSMTSLTSTTFQPSMWNEDICIRYNTLRSDINLMNDLKLIVDALKKDIKEMRNVCQSKNLLNDNDALSRNISKIFNFFMNSSSKLESLTLTAKPLPKPSLPNDGIGLSGTNSICSGIRTRLTSTNSSVSRFSNNDTHQPDDTDMDNRSEISRKKSIRKRAAH
ncbi:hypothetical protein SNEBB_004906 [Seison nebaliae]|nr:hypothetical protein SNEBB_004906 [Seison nebaliae]